MMAKSSSSWCTSTIFFLLSSSLTAIYMIKDALHKRFEMKDLGEAKVILGV